jgi:hypothetical protein
MVCLETTAAQINHFDFTSTVALHQNVLGLEITMYEPKTMNELQSFQALSCY